MMKSTHVTLPHDEYDYTCSLAKDGDRSFSAQVSRMIRQHREAREQDKNFQSYGLSQKTIPDPKKVWDRYDRSESGTNVREE